MDQNCNNYQLPQKARRELILSGMHRRIEQGLPSGKLPVGYTLEKRGEEQWIVTEPLIAPFIMRAFVHFVRTKSIEFVLAYLHEFGIKTKKGHPITAVKLRYILSNPFYIGMVRYEGKLYPGSHEAIVSREMFEGVQEKLKKEMRSNLML